MNRQHRLSLYRMAGPGLIGALSALSACAQQDPSTPAKTVAPVYTTDQISGLFYMQKYWIATRNLEKAVWYFAPDGVASLEIKRGVGVGVVGNFMAADDDVARHAGQTLDVLAAHEEGGLSLVLIQQVEQAGRALTGPVVEGESDGPYITRTVPGDGTEQGGTASADGPGSGQGTGDCEGVNGDEAFRDHVNFML